MKIILRWMPQTPFTKSRNMLLSYIYGKRGVQMKKAALRRRSLCQKELALQVIDRLKTEYPDAACTLDYDRLAAAGQRPAGGPVHRCPVNIVVQDLF